MPFPYESSKEPVRTRRTKDKDSRSTTSGSSSKRSKHITGSSSRPTSQSDRGALTSLYTQQNLTLDQLPALPESGTASPGSATSPILRATSVTSQSSTPPTPLLQHHTPVALRQYLDTDDVETPRSEVAPGPQQYQLDPSLRRSLNLQNPQGVSSKALDSDTATPQAASAQGYQPPSRDHSVSPSFFGQPLELHRSHSSRTSSARRNETASYSASSPPPPQSASPSIRSRTGQGSPAPSQQPFSPQSAFVASPSAFAQTIPYHSGLPNEPYYPSPYGGPQYSNFTNSGGHMDLQTLPPQTIPSYTNYHPPHHGQGYFGHIQNQSVRASGSPSSRLSVPGEFPINSQAVGTPVSDTSGPTKSAMEGNPADLLQRIQGAIPDLQSLLHHYKETSGQLSDKESKLQETEAQKSEAVRSRETQISQMSKELEDAKKKHQTECSRLRLELGNVEEKHKELQDNLAAEQRSKGQLQASLQASAKELEKLRKIWEDEKASMKLAFAARERKMLEDFTAKQQVMEENINHQSRETVDTLRTQLNDEKKLHAKEIESLRFSEERKRRELKEKHTGIAEELQRRLDEYKGARDESRKRYEEEIESLNKGREELQLSRDKERAALLRDLDELRKLAGRHQSEEERMRSEYQSALASARQQTEDDKAKLLSKIDQLKGERDADRGRYAKALEELKQTAANFEKEYTNLQKITEAFGEVTDPRSRGDPFYHDAFRSLEKQISDLAQEHFRECPDALRVPVEIKRSIPSGIPHLFSDTESSKNIRAAYVEHQISDLITRRIFQPFLFVLNSRHEPVDYLFQDWSKTMKGKSTKREALWRQRTLQAAYSAPNAKQSTNKTANSIIAEVVEAIRHFTHPNQQENLTVAVRRVVKTAVVTWRYARLELGLITASMSGRDIVGSHEPGPGVSFGKREDTQARATKVVFTRFPLIKRDPVPRDLQRQADTEDQGYTYSAGRILYSDDPDVVACQQGLSRHSSMSRQLQNPPIVSRTQSRAQGNVVEQETRSVSPTSPLNTPRPDDDAIPWPMDPSVENQKSPSPANSYHDDRATPSLDAYSRDDRGTPSPVESPNQDRMNSPPIQEDADEWHDAERDSGTATPVQADARSSATIPDQEMAASVRSAVMSRQSLRSGATVSSRDNR